MGLLGKNCSVKKMREQTVERYIRKYLINKGWKIRKAPKRIGEHGVDIHAWHPKWRRFLYIETKGGSGKHKHQEPHSAFYNVLGQIISRMDIQGNDPKKGKIWGQTWKLETIKQCICIV